MITNAIRLILLSALLVSLAGCEDVPKEEHQILDNGTEYGVEIEVLLKGGGTALLMCPKFDKRPRGSHGRECYLTRYDTTGKEDK